MVFLTESVEKFPQIVCLIEIFIVYYELVCIYRPLACISGTGRKK